jgi:hypothetical protein
MLSKYKYYILCFAAGAALIQFGRPAKVVTKTEYVQVIEHVKSVDSKEAKDVVKVIYRDLKKGTETETITDKSVLTENSLQTSKQNTSLLQEKIETNGSISFWVGAGSTIPAKFEWEHIKNSGKLHLSLQIDRCRVGYIGDFKVNHYAGAECKVLEF